VEELQDYRGPFRPDLKMQDFSKDALVRLWKACGALHLGLDEIWYSLMKERFGEQVALELDSEVWRRATAPEWQRISRAMNIEGDDVATLFKVCQVGPSGGAVADMQYELKHPNHGILTFVRCKPLEWVEKHGNLARQKQMCDMDQEFFDRWAHSLNPKMQVTALKLPPRKIKDGIPCVWEFRVEEC